MHHRRPGALIEVQGELEARLEASLSRVANGIIGLGLPRGLVSAIFETRRSAEQILDIELGARASWTLVTPKRVFCGGPIPPPLRDVLADPGRPPLQDISLGQSDRWSVVLADGSVLGEFAPSVRRAVDEALGKTSKAIELELGSGDQFVLVSESDTHENMTWKIPASGGEMLRQTTRAAHRFSLSVGGDFLARSSGGKALAAADHPVRAALDGVDGAVWEHAVISVEGDAWIILLPPEVDP